MQPPLTDKKLNKMFLNTLKAPYYGWMIGNSNKNFSNVVVAGEMIEAGVKQDKIKISEVKKQIPKKKEGETHMVTYQETTYNPSYPPQQNYDYQPYNQYDGSAAQRNYQSNSRPVARFPALPPSVQVVTSQLIGQSSNNVREPRPQQERFKPNPIPMLSKNCTLNRFRVAYYRQLVSHRCNYLTLDGITRTSIVIIIQAIKDTQRKIAHH